MHTLVLAAAVEELGTLPGAVVGVGPIAAATTAARIIADRRPDAVILIGTAGAYAGGPAIGTVIASETLGWSSGVAAMGLGYVPRPPQPIRAATSLLDRLDLPRHAVLTTGAITTDPTLADRLSDGFSVEHLEAYSVALACRDVGVAFVAILGIANVVGPGAHVEWLAHRDEAQDAAREAARTLVCAG